MTTRRSIVKAGAGLAAIIAAGKAPAVLVRSMLGMRNAMMAGKRLPYDAEVEYLESTGTQYIDTGIVPTIDMSVEITVAKVRYVEWGVVIGSTSFDNTEDRWYFREMNSWNFVFSMANVNGDGNPLLAATGEKVICRCSKTTFSVGEQSVSVGAISYSTRPTRPLFLFSCNYAGSPWIKRSFKGRVYGCKIYDGNALVRNFIPVRFTNEQGVSEGAMFDRANPTAGMNPDGSARTDGLYRNRGTGAFLYGNDI